MFVGCCGSGNKTLNKSKKDYYTKGCLDYIVVTTLDEECVICLNTMVKKQSVTLLKCGHTYHSQCIYGWFLIKRVCPICNIRIDVI